MAEKTYHLVEESKQLADNAGYIQPDAAGFVFSELSPRSLNGMKDILPAYNHVWQQMFKNGVVCFGLIKGEGTLVSFVWVNRNEIVMPTYDIPNRPLGLNEFYIYAQCTKPSEQGEGYASMLRYWVYSKLPGAARILSITDQDNAPAIALKAKLGAKFIEEIKVGN